MFPSIRSSHLVVFLSVFAVITVTVGAVNKYTKEERLALDKLRPLVIDALTKDYQKVDSYLIRWLRVKNLDVRAANQMLHKALKWRRDNKIDSILEEPSIFDGTGFPDSIDEIDKTGRPVFTYSMAKVDSRRILVSGKRNRLLRGYIQIWEKLEMKCQESSNRTGTEISEAVSIGDLQGFNRVQQMCLACIPFMQDVFITNEAYYPGLFKLTIAVNAPRSYELLMSRTASFRSEQTKTTTKIFGHNRAEWSDFLDKFIARDQRITQFGGTKKT